MITFHRDAPPAVTLPLCTLCRSGFTVLILGFVPGLFTRKLTNQALRHSVQKFDPWCMIGCRTILPTCPPWEPWWLLPVPNWWISPCAKHRRFTRGQLERLERNRKARHSSIARLEEKGKVQATPYSLSVMRRLSLERLSQGARDVLNSTYLTTVMGLVIDDEMKIDYRHERSEGC
jgi:hypothetical protein